MIDTEKWITELDEVENMTSAQLCAEVVKMAQQEGFPGFIAKLALLRGDRDDHLDLVKRPPKQHLLGL